MINLIKFFLAGFLATLIFHQGLMGLLYLAGVSPIAPFSLAATGPLAVPAVLSLAFWGGLWGVAIGYLLRAIGGVHSLWRWLVLGALAPSLVAMLLVFPLKGIANNDPKLWLGALLLNGAWGLGCALFLRATARWK